MAVVDYGALPEITMRDGIMGKWIAGREQGTREVTVLTNTVAPGVVVPRHTHDHEEVAVVEAGEFWFEVDGVRRSAVPGQAVIVPAGAVHSWGTLGTVPSRVLFIWPVLEPFAPDKCTYLDGPPPAVR
jgi:quercetin dioxygenase-like cupin family protein